MRRCCGAGFAGSLFRGAGALFAGAGLLLGCGLRAGALRVGALLVGAGVLRVGAGVLRVGAGVVGLIVVGAVRTGCVCLTGAGCACLTGVLFTGGRTGSTLVGRVCLTGAGFDGLTGSAFVFCSGRVVTGVAGRTGSVTTGCLTVGRVTAPVLGVTLRTGALISPVPLLICCGSRSP